MSQNNISAVFAFQNDIFSDKIQSNPDNDIEDYEGGKTLSKDDGAYGNELNWSQTIFFLIEILIF